MEIAGGLMSSLTPHDFDREEHCFLWFHDWSKWQQYQIEIMLINNPSVKGVQPMQRRNCKRCNYQQQREIDYA